MYLVQEKDLKGVSQEEAEVRLEIVNYLADWAEDVFSHAKEKSSLSLAGRYIRSRMAEKGGRLPQLLDTVSIVDLSDLWKAYSGNQGKRDDVLLYGIFCTIFSEYNEEMLRESQKLEGHIGYAPRMRFDISERTGSEVSDEAKPTKGGLFKRKKKPNTTDLEVEEDELVEEEAKPTKAPTKPKKAKAKPTKAPTKSKKAKVKGNKAPAPVKKATSEKPVKSRKKRPVKKDGGVDEDAVLIEVEDNFVNPENVNLLTVAVALILAILIVVFVFLVLF